MPSCISLWLSLILQRGHKNALITGKQYIMLVQQQILAKHLLQAGNMNS